MVGIKRAPRVYQKQGGATVTHYLNWKKKYRHLHSNIDEEIQNNTIRKTDYKEKQK